MDENKKRYRVQVSFTCEVEAKNMLQVLNELYYQLNIKNVSDMTIGDIREMQEVKPPAPHRLEAAGDQASMETGNAAAI